MPTATLMPVDLSDPSPPVPGDRERAAVRARARQLARRRRAVQSAAAFAALVGVGLGVVALASGGSGTTPVAVLKVSSSTLEPGSTVKVELKNADGSVTGEADPNGTVRFDHDIAPGTYSVFVDIERPATNPTDTGVEIGTALDTTRSIVMTLEAGVNTLDLDTLMRR